MKYILITGVDPHILTSSIGAVLKTHGYNVSVIKMQPPNRDYFTHDIIYDPNKSFAPKGYLASNSLEYYERFLDTNSTGRTYRTPREVARLLNIRAENRYDALGTNRLTIDAIQEWIVEAADGDICLLDLGYEADDILESRFIRALRKLKTLVGEGNFCHCLVGPVELMTGEGFATRPLQWRFHELLALNPDLTVCLTELPDIIFQNFCHKIATNFHVGNENIFSIQKFDTTYLTPICLQNLGISTAICRSLRLPPIDAVTC